MTCLACRENEETEGYRTCVPCSDWLWNAMSYIELGFTEMMTPAVLVPPFRVVQSAPPADSTMAKVTSIPKQANKPSSKSPARDEVIVLTDLRSKTESGHPASVPGAVAAWAARLAREIGTTPKPTVAERMRFVRAWWDHLHRQEWVAEVYRDVRLLQRRISVLMREAEPRKKPVGTCSECSSPLWYEDPHVLCKQCGNVLDGWELVSAAELDASIDPDHYMLTTSEIALLARARNGTVRQWIARSGVMRDEAGRVDVRELRDYLMTRPIPLLTAKVAD